MKRLPDLRIKLYADGADSQKMLELYGHPLIKGFTTNPSLMRAAGVTDYCKFAKDLLRGIPDKPISFEVLSDDFNEMYRQALEIASWGQNVYVKIPVTNTKGESSSRLIQQLALVGVRQNVTAILTLDQACEAALSLSKGPASYVSVFAGRIADTGQDPVPLIAAAVEVLRQYPNVELIWASPRELLNIFQAEAVGCQIITATCGILKKLDLVGKNLRDYSIETVCMFFEDARKAQYKL